MRVGGLKEQPQFALKDLHLLLFLSSKQESRHSLDGIFHEGYISRMNWEVEYTDEFDPLRNAILLIGGDKTGDDRWYDVNVPLCDRLYDEHLEELRKEGKIDG